MAKRGNKYIGGGAGALLTGAWGLYSNFTTVKDLPDDAGWFAKMLTDPPIYAPWLLFAACVIFLGWVVWHRDDGDENDGPDIHQTTHGPNSPAVGSVGRDATFNIHPTPPSHQRPKRERGEWPIADAITAIQDALGSEADAWLEFRRAALDDKIGVWGRPEIKGPEILSQRKWRELSIEIEPQYWLTWRLVRDLSALKSMSAPHTEPDDGPLTKDSYAGLTVDQAEIEYRWISPGPSIFIV